MATLPSLVAGTEKVEKGARLGRRSAAKLKTTVWRLYGHWINPRLPKAMGSKSRRVKATGAGS
jgi:hypothetical protein